ncbi:MAG: acyl carrier protein [Nannocystaceae bacterium]
MESIAARVRAEIAADLRQPVEQVPLDARIDAVELGIDSLGLIKLSVRLEEIFEVTMPDLAADPQAIGSVRDVARLIADQVELRGAGGAA